MNTNVFSLGQLLWTLFNVGLLAALGALLVRWLRRRANGRGGQQP